MNFNYHYFDLSWLLLGGLAYGWILLKAIRSAQWWRLRNPADLNVLLYTLLGIFFIWAMHINIPNIRSMDGLDLHLLGATLMTMMFGWAFAVIGMSLVLFAFMLMTSSLGLDNYTVFPWNALMSCALPVLISHRLFSIADRYLPNNFFVYIFVCAFFGAALSMLGVILSTTTVQYLTGAFGMAELKYSYLPYGLILMFPEAFTTGMLMTIFVAYRPEWVNTFDDRRYLRKKVEHDRDQ